MRVADKQRINPSLPQKSLFSFLSPKTNAPETTEVPGANAGPDQHVDITFADFFRLPHCQPLRNSLFYEKYYSRVVVDDPASAVGFVIPDLKQLPSVVP